MSLPSLLLMRSYVSPLFIADEAFTMFLPFFMLMRPNMFLPSLNLLPMRPYVFLSLC